MPNTNIPIEHHPLEPFLPSNGRVLMLGSFPPQKKRWCKDFEFYYPNFTNDMWRVFGLVFFSDALHFINSEKKTYRKEQIIAFLRIKGIALYDTACAIRRLNDNASDKFLEVVEQTDIESLLVKMPLCTTIVTTGQKASDTICERFMIAKPKVGSYTDTIVTLPDGQQRPIRLYRMPSTSRAYPLPLQKKAEAYKHLFSSIFK